jgi:hypothetical protein
MKKAGIFNIIIAVFTGLFVFSVPGWAKWTEPVFIGELNDYSFNSVALLPRVSPDGSTIYFLRGTPQGNALFEARFNEASSLYSNQRLVSELGTQGRGIPSLWVSPDGLRMYYAEPIVLNGQWQRVIRLADRSSTSLLWTYRKNLMELHKNIVDTSVSLTADELTIIWTSKPLNSAGVFYQATRSSLSQSFGTARVLTELSASIGEEISLSADGLTLYFERRTSSATVEIWKGARPTINDPFGNFEPLSDINQLGRWTGNPCVSQDQQIIWFLQGRDESVNLSSTGIYISHWEDEPYVKALKALLEAYNLKQESLQIIDLAIEKENEALLALADLLKTGLPEGLTRRDINKVRLNILYALCKQFTAEFDIKRSLKELGKGILVLDPNALDPK